MSDFYDDMATMTRELLAPTNQNGLGQGVIQLVRITQGVPDPAAPWLPVTPIKQTEKLDGAVKGVSSQLVGTEAGSAVILASDREAICTVPKMSYKAGDMLSIDGVDCVILAAMPIPAAGATVALRFIVRS